MTVELKACPNPWCEAAERDGDHSPAVRLHHFGNYRVVCTSCLTEGPLRSTKDEAIAAWNERTAPAVPQDMAGLIAELQEPWTQTQSRRVDVERRAADMLAALSQQPSPVAVGEDERPPILGAFVNHARDVLQRHSTPSEGDDDVALALMIELAKIAGDRPAAFTLENGGPIGTIMKQQHAAIRTALTAPSMKENEDETLHSLSPRRA